MNEEMEALERDMGSRPSFTSQEGYRLQMDIQDMGCHPSLSSQEGNWLEMKYNLDGSVNHYKARLIAKGYMQKHTVLTMKRHLPLWQR